MSLFNEFSTRSCRFGLFWILFCSCVSNEHHWRRRCKGVICQRKFGTSDDSDVSSDSGGVTVLERQSSWHFATGMPCHTSRGSWREQSIRPERGRLSAVSLPSGWPIVSPPRSSKRRNRIESKERKKCPQNQPPNCSPLRGHPVVNHNVIARSTSDGKKEIRFNLFSALYLKLLVPTCFTNSGYP